MEEAGRSNGQGARDGAHRGWRRPRRRALSVQDTLDELRRSAPGVAPGIARGSCPPVSTFKASRPPRGCHFFHVAATSQPRLKNNPNGGYSYTYPGTIPGGYPEYPDPLSRREMPTQVTTVFGAASSSLVSSSLLAPLLSPSVSPKRPGLGSGAPGGRGVLADERFQCLCAAVVLTGVVDWWLVIDCEIKAK